MKVHAEVVRSCGNVAIVGLCAADLFSDKGEAQVSARVVDGIV